MVEHKRVEKEWYGIQDNLSIQKQTFYIQKNQRHTVISITFPDIFKNFKAG